MSDVKVEKRPGPDWTVWYEDEGIEHAYVFGAATIDEALADFRSSFMSGHKPPVVVAVARD